MIKIISELMEKHNNNRKIFKNIFKTEEIASSTAFDEIFNRK